MPVRRRAARIRRPERRCAAAARHQDGRFSPGPQMPDDVLDPGQFRLTARRQTVDPAGVTGQLVVTPRPVTEGKVAEGGVETRVRKAVGGQRVAGDDPHVARTVEMQAGAGDADAVRLPFLPGEAGRAVFPGLHQQVADSAGGVVHGAALHLDEARHEPRRRRRRRDDAPRVGFDETLDEVLEDAGTVPVQEFPGGRQQPLRSDAGAFVEEDVKAEIAHHVTEPEVVGGGAQQLPEPFLRDQVQGFPLAGEPGFDVRQGEQRAVGGTAGPGRGSRHGGGASCSRRPVRTRSAGRCRRR
ncbi:hypothetical protein LUX32_17025 [Actinomadura madurae]|nr:hypothetical protein [Actinomadura madurae]MCP9979101.1 hypothetical protein [Actinomadura madurae]